MKRTKDNRRNANEGELAMKDRPVARVVVAKNARNIDKLFDYEIPAQLRPQLCIGSRVIVPFGPRNALAEGYVVEISAPKSRRKLKSIDSLAAPQSVFDQKAWELACWMREKYLCTYYEAIRQMIPAGTAMKFEDWVCLCEMSEDKREALVKRSALRRQVIALLQAEGGMIEMHRLLSMVNKNIRPSISSMEKAGLVRIVQVDSSQVKDKLVRFASLSVSAEEAAAQAQMLKKSAPKQAAILETLCYDDEVALAELVYLAQANYNAVHALCQKGLVELFDKEVLRDPVGAKKIPPTEPHEMTDEQSEVLDALCAALNDKKSRTFLLHGVTGSGKTEVYMQLIARAIAQKRTAIVLVPEISLTPQMTQRFISRFGRRVAILHSALSLGERYDEWKRIRGGEVDVVVGARSAVFAPLDRIGVIILDEEHETTYKSENAPRYHAREVAIFRSGQHGALTILASATPSVESYYKAKTGEYSLLSMSNRYNDSPLPEVYVVDMRKELAEGNRSMFSVRLRRELEKNLENGQQSILLLNRRGFSTFVSCRACGYVAKCPHCSITLTYHRTNGQLACHYCGYSRDNYTLCPECKSRYIKYFGAGTQRLEDELKKQFKDIGVIRMDADTTGTKNSHQRLLERFEKEKVDVLIGTQMVSKGLDFPNVTLVGVVAADVSLYIDDFRSGERTFNIIMQVAGRAGRGSVPGRAVIQTYSPEHAAIRYAKSHDYAGFYEEEIKLRRAMWYPPFSEIVSILVSSTSELLAARRIKEIAKFLRFRCGGGEYGRLQILGPSSAGISKIKDKYRCRIIIKCESADRLGGVLKEIIDDHMSNENSKWVSLTIDKNPISLA